MKKVLLILLLAGLALAAYAYYAVAVRPAVPAELEEPVYLHVPTGSTYEQVKDSLRALGITPDETVFDFLADRMSYRRESMRAGRYEIQPGWSHLKLIRQLRGGRQAPVEVVLTTEREPMNVAAKAARFIESDSLAIWTLLQDRTYLDSLGYTPETLQSLFIPNTYEFYWNTSPRTFIQRMVEEHERFWESENRREKARQLGLTPAEVYTLASIVEKETLVNAERRRMAGVYLNRLRIGMPLQADPTVVFATRDFDTKRVTFSHTGVDSPYNTYKNVGLPPGPIAMASIGSIDAVLNAENHDYVYFCAVGDGSGLHNFAETFDGHQRNIAVYKANLRARGLL